MPDTKLVASHYTHGGLLDAITAGVEKLGKTRDTISIDDLSLVDEFHIGGRVATESFLDRVGLNADDYVLDVGCGLGGASRFASQRYGCRVAGIDLTPEYIETGNMLCSWVGPAGQVNLEQGNATATPYADVQFDKIYMLHVGMNIADKSTLSLELHRILKPGGTLGIYDIMRVGNGTLKFPLPWAANEAGSAVAPPDGYKDALETAGFEITEERNRRDFALEFFARLQADATDGPPPLGTHILMGESTQSKLQNVIHGISENLIAPIELIAKKTE